MKSKTPKNIRCYDNGGETFDRYTVIYLEFLESLPDTYSSVGMNASPFHPQGFGQHCAATPGKHLGRRIAFSKLPTDCQKLVMQDLRDARITEHAAPTVKN